MTPGKSKRISYKLGRPVCLGPSAFIPIKGLGWAQSLLGLPDTFTLYTCTYLRHRLVLSNSICIKFFSRSLALSDARSAVLKGGFLFMRCLEVGISMESLFIQKLLIHILATQFQELYGVFALKLLKIAI